MSGSMYSDIVVDGRLHQAQRISIRSPGHDMESISIAYCLVKICSKTLPLVVVSFTCISVGDTKKRFECTIPFRSLTSASIVCPSSLHLGEVY
mmetsp:Transcript_1198/g.2315  ORF Transcript_1198/g.2315 Transcript_1198/m.2315 type:complete len:93 (-) Transcript_1198:689-967(-)